MEPTSPLLSCHGLYKSYGRRKVLAGCNIEVGSAEIVGLVGENGSGKSTLVRCLLGFTPPDAGDVRLGGTLGYCPQDDYLDRRLTVREHFALTATILERRGKVDPAFLEMLVDRLRLRPYLDTLVGDLSGGTYQKVKFATSALHQPDLLVLDEPCDGFDWAMYQVFWEVVESLRAQRTSVLMISHLLHERHRFGRILEMRAGALHEA